jgi:hypothetical protein
MTVAREDLKTEYLFVLEAIEVANVADDRVVTIKEVVEALPPEGRDKLDKAYSRPVKRAVSRIARRLRSKGFVFSPGKIGRERFYGSVEKLDPATAELPEKTPRRRRVLAFVRVLVDDLGRAVRHADVVDAAETHDELSDLTPELIGRDLQNLTRTGELEVVGEVRGDGRGRNLYLSPELDSAEYAVDEPLTWLEQVAATFETLWEEETAEAAAENRKPRPLSTGCVRARLSREQPELDQLEDPQLLVNAMRQLAESSRPVVQAIRRPNEKVLLWAPIDVDEEDLDVGDAFATDSERVATAVARAEVRRGRPVTVLDVRDEIEMDPTLRPAGSQDLHVILWDVAKETVDHGGERRARRHQRIVRLGRVEGKTYYSARADEEAVAHVRAREFEARWKRLDAPARVAGITDCILPTVAAGRVMLLQKELGVLREELAEIDMTGDLHSADRDLLHRLAEAADNTNERLARMMAELGDVAADLPDVRDDTPGLTPRELQELLEPLYPRAAEVDDPTKLVPLLEGAIRRIPNPEYESRWSQDHHKACEYLFDRTDALLEAAKRWGGHQCRLHAMMAQGELGRLQDPCFLLPALQEADYQRRLRGVACLAFVPSEQGRRRLREVATEDADRGVRESSAWAYGFAGGGDGKTLTTSGRDAAGVEHGADGCRWWRA